MSKEVAVSERLHLKYCLSVASDYLLSMVRKNTSVVEAVSESLLLHLQGLR